jgi:hypothetical protein
MEYEEAQNITGGSRSYAARMGLKAKLVNLTKKWASRIDKTVSKFIAFVFSKKNRESTPLALLENRSIFHKEGI